MNIYLHLEISARELDSKLFLAILAAARGHEVVVANLEVLEKGLIKGWLPSGVFHTKSITPSESKINRHKAIINKGCKITSIDEEACIDRFNYEKFLKIRYSDETINQSSAVFTWGDEDFEVLNKHYERYSDKIYKTGSPRADLWNPSLSEYWSTPKKIPKKPFLLVSSNITVFERISFLERIRMMKETGYFDRNPDLFKKKFVWSSNDHLKAITFIEAIKHLSKNNNGYDIVVRPHPSEDVSYWNVLLEGTPNVHIIREGAISSWVKNAFAVMHHACTTAVECTISRKPLVTFAAKELKDHIYQNDLANQLGYVVDTKESLLNKINDLYDESKNNTQKNNFQLLPSLVSKKVFIDDNELAAEKMIKIWENISDNKIYKPINLTKFRFFIFKMRLNRLIGDVLKKLFFSKFGNFGTSKNFKLTPFDMNEITNTIAKVRKIQKIDTNIECKLLSKNAIIIRRK
tara:strand:+ start:180 stop:1565 length:1386 start_codon:yes stop_codon:yes gene_type:complete